MKTYIKILSIAAVVAASVSCTQIDDYPDGRISFDELFSDASKTGGYLNSCYGGAVVNYGNVYGNSSFLAAACDEAHDVDDAQGGAMLQWNNGFLNPFNNPVSALSKWDLYQYIRKCNIMLAHVNTATVMLPSERVSYEGEARGLRAFYYLQLIKTYGNVPLILNNTTEIPSQEDWKKVKVASFGEIARFIIDECRDVIENNDQLTWRSGSTSSDQSRFCKGILAAVMSEAALYAASPLYADGTITWKEAAEVCKEALDKCINEGGYALRTKAPEGEYTSLVYNAYDFMFITAPDVKGTDDPEAIMAGRNQLNVWATCGLPTTYGSSSAGSCPSQELVDCYETLQGEMPVLGYSDPDHLHPILNPNAQYDDNNPYENRDPRLKATIYYNGAPFMPSKPDKTVNTAEGGECAISASLKTNTRTGYYIRKFCSPSSSSRGNKDGTFRVYRLAELYLNYAEAANEAVASDNTKAPSEAVAAVNTIRARVGMPALPEGLSKSEFRTRVRNERRVELAYEGKRFFDVRRWKILDSSDKVITGMRPTADGYSRFIVSRRSAWTDQYLNLPLPGDDVSRILEATGENIQNPYWK